MIAFDFLEDKELLKRYNNLDRRNRNYVDTLFAASLAFVDYGTSGITCPHFMEYIPDESLGQKRACYVVFNALDEARCVKTLTCKISDMDDPDYIYNRLAKELNKGNKL